MTILAKKGFISSKPVSSISNARLHAGICVRVSHQGSYAFVSAMDFGTSKQMKKAGQAEAYRADRKGKSMSYKVGSMIGQGLTSIGRSKSKLEEEQNYYACIIDIFDEIVS